MITKRNVIIEKKDKNGNTMYREYDDEYKIWSDYNYDNNTIHVTDSNGTECWAKYNKNHKLVYVRDGSMGLEKWYDEHKCIVRQKKFEI